MHYLRVGIVKRKRSPPVSVTWLPHRSRIDEVARVILKVQSYGFRLSNRSILRAEAIG